MNREEKIKLAEDCRSRGKFPPLGEGEITIQPVKRTIRTEDDDTVLYCFDGTEGNAERPLFINLHGGGFIKGRAERDTLYCSWIAETFHAHVWDIDYVLAPEYPFPAAVYQAFHAIGYAYAHAKEYGFDKDQIFVLGHSAGGSLAAAAMILNHREPCFKVKGLLLDYIPADQRINPFEKVRMEDLKDERRISRAKMESDYLTLYMEPEECVDELASVILADDETLGSFPETLVITAGLDSLCDEGERFAIRLAQAGTAVTWKRFVNSPHGFMINRNGEWKEALQLHRRFLGGLLDAKGETL